jgi:O-acetylserine/cysteine efflux transporter
MSFRDSLFAALAVLVLGVNIVAIKVAVGMAPPLLVTGLRFAAVGLVMAWVFPFPKQLWRQIFALSVIQGLIHHGMMFVAFEGIDAVVAAIIIQLGSPFAALFAWIILGEQFGWRRTLGMILAFSGVMVLAGQPDVWSANISVALLVVSVMAWGYANIHVKRMGDINMFQVTTWMSIFAAPQLMISSWVLETGQWDALLAAPPLFWGCIFYMSLGTTVIGYGIWYYLLRQYSVAQIVPYALVQPVIGVVSGVLILGETLTWEKIMGGIIVLVGVAVIQIRSGRVQTR